MTSRTAPCPPSARVTQAQIAFASGQALATVIGSPARFNSGFYEGKAPEAGDVEIVVAPLSFSSLPRHSS